MAAVGVPGDGGEIVPSTHGPGDGSDLLRIDMNKGMSYCMHESHQRGGAEWHGEHTDSESPQASMPEW